MNTKYVRVIVALMLMAVMLTALSACGKEVSCEEDVPTEEMMAQINVAVKQKYGYELNLRWGTRYYGTYDGCSVFFQEGTLCVAYGETVAGYVFSYPYSHTILAYKDGEIYTLQEAYDQGFVTKEQIGQAHQRHMEYELARQEKNDATRSDN